MNCSWPGNIRELENCIERSALSVTGNEITPEEFACSRGEVCLATLLDSGSSGQGCGEHAVCIESLNSDSGGEKKFFCEHFPKKDIPPVREQPAEPETRQPADIPLVVDDEKQMILDALEKTGWVQAKAARLLGMTVRQINYRIAKFGIDVKKM
jgi:Nif-specific regulatory protein